MLINMLSITILKGCINLLSKTVSPASNFKIISLKAEKASDCLDWTKLTEILKNSGTD